MAHSLWLIAFGAIAAGFVQGLSGFGFGLVALSIWAWTLDPQLAAVLAVFGALTGQIVAAVSMRRPWQWQLLWPFLAGAVVGVPVGVMVLARLNPAVFKFLLGTLLACWCPIMLMSSRLPRVSFGGRTADGLIGAAGGAMGGIGGFTGAIPTLWCTLRGMDKDAQRAVIQNFNLCALAATMLSYLIKGMVTTSHLPLFAIVAPALLVPSLLGTRLYIGLSEQAFRKLVLALLTVSGAVLISASAPAVWRGLTGH